MAGPVATGYLELDLSGFNRAIESAKKALTVLTAAFAAIKVAEFFKDGVKEAINFGNEMYNAGKAMGNIDPGSLLLLQKALQAGGLSASAAREEVESFMRSGRQISTAFKSPGDFTKAITEAKANYGSQAAVLTASAANLSRAFDYIQSIADKIKTFFLAMTAKFILPLEAVLNALNNVDVADFGAKLGDSIASVSTILVGLFNDGKLSEAFGLSLAIGADKFFATMETSLRTVFAGAASGLGKEMLDYFQGGWLMSIKDAFLAIVDLFIAKMTRGINAILKKIPFYNKETIQQNDDEIKSREASSNESLKKYLDAIPGAKGFGEGFTKQQKEAEDSLKKLTDAASISGEAFMKKNAGDRSKAELNYSALGKQDPYSVIGSSMAKIGGGGNYIQTGMSAEARQLILNGQAALIQNQLTQQLIDIAKTGRGLPLLN
jgi:hypothetical protein